jgi:hypothetical protein
MNEKQKLYRAKRLAAMILQRSGYRVVFLSGDPIFDIEATRASEMRKLLVSMSQLSENERDKISEINLPTSCHKEVWIKHPREAKFKIETIL